MALGGSGTFVRTWLPLLILAVLIGAIFPRFGPREDRDALEAWDGIVLLVRLEPPPVTELRVLATLPLRTRSGDATERLVVGEASFAPGSGPQPLLLSTPSDDLGQRLARRVIRDVAAPESTRPILIILPVTRSGTVAGPAPDHRPADSSVGSIWRPGELVGSEGSRPIPSALREVFYEITPDLIRHRRWKGNPDTFHADWRRFSEVDPGGLTSFIHDRVTLEAKDFTEIGAPGG